MNKTFKWLLASAAVALVAACGGGGDDANDRFDLASPKLRLVNLDPVSPTVSLYDNISLIPGTSGGYKFASAYVNIKDDSHDYVIRTDTGNVEVGRETLDPDTGSKYTMIKFGPTDADVIMVRDPYDKGSSSKARIRVVNAAINSDAAGFDVYIKPNGTDIQASTADLTGVTYREVDPATNDNSIEVDGRADYEITFAVSGTSPKVTSFNTNTLINIPSNGDWLIAIIPVNPAIPNSVRALLIPDGGATSEPN